MLSEQHTMIRDALREFSQQQLLPHAAKWDRERSFPAEPLRALAAMGAFGVAVPEAQGGAGLDYVALALVIEEIAAGDGGASTIISAKNQDLPLPLPPCAPLYLEGSSSGSNTSAVFMCRTDNFANDLVYQWAVWIACHLQR